MKKFVFATLAAALCLIMVGCGTEKTLPEAPSTDIYESEEVDPSAPYSVDFRLTSGHHTAGIDFPAGTYHLQAIQWCGNVRSSNGSVDLSMGTTDFNTDGLNQYLQEVSEKKDMPEINI